MNPPIESSIQELFAAALSGGRASPAVVTRERTLTYAELASIASALARQFTALCDVLGGPRLLGIYGGQTADTYAAIAAAILGGGGYVPLNPDFPPDRSAFMVADSGLRVLFVADAEQESFRRLQLLLPPGLTIIGMPRDSAAVAPGALPKADAQTIAYILYTSGSTGRPKGVRVSHGNVTHYVRELRAEYQFTSADRFSQLSDLTFDFSVLGIFCAFACGGALFPFGKSDKFSPVRYVRSNALTIWYSVPSLAVYAQELNMLKPGSMPSLRVSIFCGEALTVRTADAWQRATPTACLDNHYGPTEATVSCAWFRWNAASHQHEYRNGIVPIGLPMPGTTLAVADPQGNFVPPGTEGELCIGGAQVCLGYTDELRTRAVFFTRENPATHQRERWYKTGDRAVYNTALATYEYLGRLDSQVKIQGYRVELGEVESVIRKAYGSDSVVVIPHPIEGGAAKGLVAFLEVRPNSPSLEVIVAACHAQMPHYMCPAAFHFLNQIPLNSNGKFDRRELARRCEEHEFERNSH